MEAGARRSPPQRVGLFHRPGHEAARAAALGAAEAFGRAGLEVELSDRSEELEGALDVCLSLGGDGTLLHLARVMAPRKVPVLGVNFGRVGYLCAVSEKGLDDALERIVRGEYGVDARTMVRARVFDDGEKIWEHDALNEILVGGSTRTLTLEVEIDGELFSTIRGDGIIVSTQTGSTAYAFSAGGSILLLDALILVAANAVFSSSMRSVVLPLESTVRVRNRTRVASPYVITDGQIDYQIQRDMEVEFLRSPVRALLVDLGLESPVEKLSRGFEEQRTS